MELSQGGALVELRYLRFPPLDLPTVLPTPDAMKSGGENKYAYHPDAWELEYGGYRYLGRASDDVIRARYRSILRNMRALVSSDRHVIPRRSFLSSWYWYRKEHQTRFEFHLRSLSLPEQPPAGFLHNAQPNAPVRPRSPNACDVLFRYGSLRWMRAFLETGRVRISAASSYLKAEDDARADDERRKVAFLAGEYSRMTTEDGTSIPAIGDITRTVSFPDYYVLCGSCDWDDALFDAFGADACVVIRDPRSFEARLEKAAAQHLPGWQFLGAPVGYFDPYETRLKTDLMPPLDKDFRFAYQREYRWSWTPLDRQQTRGVIDLELGSLADVATLHLRR